MSLWYKCYNILFLCYIHDIMRLSIYRIRSALLFCFHVNLFIAYRWHTYERVVVSYITDPFTSELYRFISFC